MTNKAEEKFSYQKNLSALFASFSVLCFGALSLLNNFSIDLYSVLFMFSIVLPASLSMAFMGFVIGRIFDTRGNFGGKKPKGKSASGEDNAYKIKSIFSDDAVADGASMFDENEASE